MDPREFVGGDRGREILELLSSVLEPDTLEPMLVERDVRQRGDLADLRGASVRKPAIREFVS